MKSGMPLGTATEEGIESSNLGKSSSSSWLDIIKKIYQVVQQIIPLIKSCFNMSSSSSSSSGSKSSKDVLTQLANILPTSTFLTFQVIAPLATNNGNCGNTEKIVTGVLLGVFAAIITFSSFTDSVKISSTGKTYYGIVTSKGLWNPTFQSAGIPGVTGSYYTGGGNKYNLRMFDFVNAALSLSAFAALSLLTGPVNSCYFKHLSSTVLKAVPLTVAAVISFVLSFAPAARNGIGYKVDASDSNTSSTQASLLHEPAGSSSGP